MLILRRHWVAGGKCDVTLTPALVDIYKKASEQSVSSFTITTRQSGTIIAESLTNSNDVPYFTIDKNSFSPGTTTVTVTGIAFEEGYPTNIGRIIIKCRGGGKQIIDVDYADCNLDISVDSLLFDDEHGTVTFDITSTAGGTINDSHITKVQTGETLSSGDLYIYNYDKNNGYDVTVDYYKAGASSLANPEAWHEVDNIHLDENIPDSAHIKAASYLIDPSLPYSVTPGKESDTVDYENDNIVYSVTDNSSPVMAPAVSISPKTFNSGTTTITATINENSSAGDLGYLVISNSCGATTNVNVTKINGTCSLELSIDNLQFDANTKTVTFNVISDEAGTIDTDNIAKVTEDSGEPSITHLHASGNWTSIPAGQTVQLEELEINFDTAEERDEAYANGAANALADVGGDITVDNINVTTGENAYTYKIFVNGSATNNGSSDTQAHLYFGADYHSSSESESVQIPAVTFSPTSFSAGTTEIIATLSNLVTTGDLGYAVFRSNCGATDKLNISYGSSTNSGGSSGSGDDEEEHGIFLYLTKSKTIPNSETPDSDYYHYPNEIPSYVNEHIYTLQNGHGLLDDGTYLATHYNIYVWMGGDLTDAGMSNAVLAFYYNSKDWLEYYDFYKDK